VTTIVLATRNAHKAQEMRAMLGAAWIVRTLEDFPNAPSVVEDAATFEGNAAKKARTLAQWLCQQNDAGNAAAVLADDSGLEVDFLQGAPGVHSARFASAGPENSPDAANNAKLLRLLETVPPDQRTARFRCVLALAPDIRGGEIEFFAGACEGRIARERAGQGGFGYDPLFVPEGQTRSFAELGEDVKNRISHRAQAMARLKRRLAVG
jgi:XTP/dITP diphosphohydrolase